MSTTPAALAEHFDLRHLSDAFYVDPYPHLTRSGVGRVDLLESEDVAGHAVLDRPPGAHDAATQAAGSSASGRFDRPRTLLEYARFMGWRSS